MPISLETRGERVVRKNKRKKTGRMKTRRPEKEYIAKMSMARVIFYRPHYRAKDNEWILQELSEWGDEVQMAAMAAWKHGKMTQREYQEAVSAARDAWEIAAQEIKEYEVQAEYIGRLCGIN